MEPVVTHSGLKTQVYVVCDKTKLVRLMFKKEPNVPLLVDWTK